MVITEPPPPSVLMIPTTTPETSNKTITFTMDEVESDSILGDAAYGTAKAIFDGTKSYNEGKDDAKGKYVEIGGVKYFEHKD